MPYTPLVPPRVGDPRFMATMEYVYGELRRLEQELYSVQLPELHVEPTRPRAGMIVLADGSDWNPGGGAGFYGYHSGAWNKLG